MAYREPNTRVTIVEEDTSAVAPPGKLLPCQVGPAFQIEIQELGGSYDGSDVATQYAYPGQLALSTVQTDSVEVFITNTVDGITYDIPSAYGGTTFWTATTTEVTLEGNIYAVIATGTVGVVGIDLSVFEVDTSLADVTIYAGDELNITTAGTLFGEHTVAGKDTNGNIVVQTDFANAATGLEWEIRRYLAGNVYITYHALRGDMVNNRTWYDDQDEVVTAAGGNGAITDDNPLFLAAWIATASGGGTYVCGVDDDDGSFDADAADLIAWGLTFDYLQDFDNMYSFVILTQNESVIALSQTFVDWMSLPNNRAEAVAFCSPPRTTEEVAISATQAGAGGVTATFTVAGDEFSDTSIADFTIYGCSPMGYVEVTYNDTVYKMRTQSVTATVITILDPSTGPAAIYGVGGAAFTYRYVNDYYDSSEEANYYKEYSESYIDKRVRFAFPSTIGMTIDSILTVIPSFYWWAYRSGLINTNVNPATPYTNTSASIFSRSYLPFRKKTYLNTVAEGGWEIIMQDATNLPLYCRHQLTTDMTHPARAEQSVVHAVDHCAKYVRSVLDPNIGKYNGSPAYISMIKTLISGVRAYLVQKIQSLASMRTTSVTFDEDDPRDLNVEIRVGARYPVNNIDIVLIVS